MAKRSISLLVILGCLKRFSRRFWKYLAETLKLKRYNVPPET